MKKTLAELISNDINKPGHSERKAKQNEQFLKCEDYIVIDCEFEEQMTHKEMKSLKQQLGFSQNASKKKDENLCIIQTNITKESKLYPELTQLSHNHWPGCIFADLTLKECMWHVNNVQENKFEFVYLSADSDEVLDYNIDNKILIVGGIIDRNRNKNICFEKAKQMGLKSAKFPIDKEDLKTSQRSAVLTTVNCIEIIINQKILLNKVKNLNSSKTIKNEEVDKVEKNNSSFEKDSNEKSNYHSKLPIDSNIVKDNQNINSDHAISNDELDKQYIDSDKNNEINQKLIWKNVVNESLPKRKMLENDD